MEEESHSHHGSRRSEREKTPVLADVLSSSLFFHSGFRPMGWSHPHSKQVFPRPCLVNRLWKQLHRHPQRRALLIF
jgi:hypothetical protein